MAMVATLGHQCNTGEKPTCALTLIAMQGQQTIPVSGLAAAMYGNNNVIFRVGNQMIVRENNKKQQPRCLCSRLCVCFLPIHSGHQVRWTYQPGGHSGGRSHGIPHPPSFCGTCLNFSREKDSAIPFPCRP